VDVDIDWGDGSAVEAFTTDSPSHVYATADTYTIEVTGSCDAFAFNNGGDKDKLLAVNSAGSDFDCPDWTGAFYGAGSVTAIDLSGIGAVTDFVSAFRTCINLVSIDFGNLDVSAISPNSLGSMFFGCSDLETLDLTKFGTVAWATALRSLDGCSSLTALDVSVLDTSALSDAREMFDNCSSVVISGLDDWDVTALTTAANFMRNANNALSTAAYDDVLVAWEAQAVNDNVSVHFGDATYTSGSAADTARTALANDHGWSIVDGGGVTP
jgi:hypothetical protein